MSFATFNSEIVTALKEITELDEVYNYPETEPDGFPYALVVENNGVDEYLDTSKNETSYNFSIIVVEMMKKGLNSSYASLRSLADSVISKIELNEFGDFSLLNTFNFSTEQRGNGQILVFSANLLIRTTNPVPT